MAIQLIQNGATTCIDSSYNINYNGTALEEIWFCDTSNATCTQVWKKKLGITITACANPLIPVNNYLGEGCCFEGDFPMITKPLFNCSCVDSSIPTCSELFTVNLQCTSSSGSSCHFMVGCSGCMQLYTGHPILKIENNSNKAVTLCVCSSPFYIKNRSVCVGCFTFCSWYRSGTSYATICDGASAIWASSAYGGVVTNCITVPANTTCCVNTVLVCTYLYNSLCDVLCAGVAGCAGQCACYNYTYGGEAYLCLGMVFPGYSYIENYYPVSTCSFTREF